VRRTLHRFALVSTLAAGAAALAATSWGRPDQSPFFIAPSPTQECHDLAYCYGIAGPWVVVPATGEATFMFGCPERAATLGKFLLGGTDSLASAPSVRVWFDGRLGAPIGLQSPGDVLLFHAAANNGKQSSFQPIVGCISLAQAVKRSTVSARLASPPRSAPPIQPRATNLILAPGDDRSATTSCLQTEKLVGNWSAVSYGTQGPPKLPPAGAVTIQAHDAGNTVQAAIHTTRSVPYLIRIQIGAMCEP
jgi:hypothetical protein